MYRSPETTLVACVWMPRFPVQVERWREPALDEAALAVLTASLQPVVIACSPEAQAEGVRIGMTLREVLSAAPRAALRTEDPYLYREVFRRATAGLESISPLVDIATPGCAFLGLEGLVAGGYYEGLRRQDDALRRPAAGLYRSPQQLIEALEAAVPPLWRVRMGIAQGKFTAWAAARLGRRASAFSRARETRQTMEGQQGKEGQQGWEEQDLRCSDSRRTCWVGEASQQAFLAPLAVHSLPVSREMRRRLRNLGLKTLGQLAALPLPPLINQFGKEGRRAWLLARGIDEEPLLPRKEPVEVVETLEFSAPEATLEGIILASQRLLERVLNRPEARGRGIRQVRLDAALESKRIWSRLVTFKQPGMMAARLFPPIRFHLERDHPAEAVETLSLVLTAFTPSLGGQGALFPEPQQERQERVREAARHLRTLMGTAPVSRIVEVEPWSRIPERRHHLLSYDP